MPQGQQQQLLALLLLALARKAATWAQQSLPTAAWHPLALMQQSLPTAAWRLPVLLPEPGERACLAGAQRLAACSAQLLAAAGPATPLVAQQGT